MSTEQHLIQVCQQIAQSGKTPSMALLRAKKTIPASMPQMVAALKSWENAPEVNANTASIEEQPVKTNDAERITSLERQIMELTLRINQLETSLSEVMQSQKRKQGQD